MTKKNWIIIVVISLSVLIFFELYIRHDHPQFFETIIETSKEDEELMSNIGGYSSFEYEFNKNDLNMDTLTFQIKIIGKRKDLLYTGKAVKGSNNEWIVIEKKSSLSE